MKKTHAKLFLLTLAFFISFFCIQKVSAQDFGGLETTAGAANLKGVTSVQTLIGNIIGAVLSLISVVFFALMLFAGIRWMTARGNEEAEKKARDTIFAGAIGMVIIMASYGLTNLVFNAATRGGTMVGSPKVSEKKDGKQLAGGGNWCLNAQFQCVDGGNDPCPGKLFNSQDECVADPAAIVVCLNEDNSCSDGVASGVCQSKGGIPFIDLIKCQAAAASATKLAEVENNPEGFCTINSAIASICPKLNKDGCQNMADVDKGCKWDGKKCIVNSTKCDGNKNNYSICTTNPECIWVGKFVVGTTNTCMANGAVEAGCAELSDTNCKKEAFCKFIAAGNCQTNYTDNDCKKETSIESCLSKSGCMN